MYSTCCANKTYKITYPWKGVFIKRIALHENSFLL